MIGIGNARNNKESQRIHPFLGTFPKVFFVSSVARKGRVQDVPIEDQKSASPFIPIYQRLIIKALMGIKPKAFSQ